MGERKQKKSQLAIFLFCVYSLSKAFNDINDNLKIKRLCAISFYTNKVQKLSVYIKNKTTGT